MKHERTYRWADPADLAARARACPGSIQMRAMAEGRIPPPPVGSLIGVNGMAVEKGKVSLASIRPNFTTTRSAPCTAASSRR